MLISLPISELKPGMFVDRVNKQAQGASIKIKTRGMVRDASIIKRLLSEGVEELTIDFAQSDIPIPTHLKPKSKKEHTGESQDIASQAEKPKLSDRDHSQATLEQEFLIASTCYDQSLGKLRAMYNELTSGMQVNMALLSGIADDIVDSVFRNPDAMAALTLLRDRNSYTWRHMMNCAILTAIFAKYLGFEINKVRQMALAALLHDIGLAKVPQGILSKPGKLTELETKAVRKHVALSLTMLKGQKHISSMMLEMVVNHHERLDGSGYPRGIKADKLSREARILALVDVYAAMVADKPYKKGEEPLTALRFLLAQKAMFDQALVQRFIKCVGIHPVGTLVKLTNERLALVVQGNEANPIKPKVRVFYNTQHRHHITAKDIDLSISKDDIKILGSTSPLEFDLNLSRLLKEHLLP
ncbi:MULTISPECIES: HD-GYP domain-containing protein [Pseudoalteromonas]|uniref:HD-GYP domain-containing protein n=1 Tax=Pseudoalteromonas TaxID=53246 RepID=UPI001022E293|nr:MULTISPECIES: HD-GYP domain-containing protein [Pseudoalteromonas]RZF77643.1 HD-GYP domain-containing protein [Pseudoalteromonas sp. CO325X]TMO89518.1 phosphodiesterase [Pseudoalteromonas ruthenica]TMP22521.1 phosphodiesterase [Pseudoalteromonas ruthenica]